MAINGEALLQAILSMTARQAFPPSQLAEIIGPGAKQIDAYNLCDGTKTQGQIASELKLDAGNFSRTVARWIDEGIVFRLGEGRDSRLQHIYALRPRNGKNKAGSNDK